MMMDTPRSAFDPSRRAALGTLTAPVLAAACGQRLPYSPAEFRVPASSPVVVLRAGSYDIDFGDLIGRGLRELGADLTGKRVFLKPNLVEYRPDASINTDPRLIAGAVTACLRAGARGVLVGEGPGHRRDTEYLVSATGLLNVMRDERIAFVDLNQDDVRSLRLRSRFTGMDALALPASLLDADVIVSMPKLKTHHWTGMTCSMKNLFGAVPGAVYGWPKNVLHMHGIENSIVDLTATIRPHLAIVDGVVGMEGDGPIMGRPKPLGVVVMGADPVAVDATCARLIGLEPYRMGYLRTASRFLGNLDEDRIEQRGERPERLAVRFELIDLWKPLREPVPFWVRWFV
jgi:uncharacterized protein (DUF362 family)